MTNDVNKEKFVLVIEDSAVPSNFASPEPR